MKTVLFLGAGASIDAGYPPAAQLLERICEFAKGEIDRATKENINLFFREIESINDPLLKMIIDSPNPEHIFTALDLLKATMGEYDHTTWKEHQSAIRQGDEEAGNEVIKRWDFPLRERLQRLSHATNGLRTALQIYFGWRHYNDNLDENGGTFEYLVSGFEHLNEGDTIVTTNWDTLAERSLLMLGKWCPAEGYGFKASLEERPLGRQLRSGEGALHKCDGQSIKVLKLHGSLGWYRRNDTGPIYLDHPFLLQYLPNHSSLYDIYAPEIGPPENPVFVMPSFLKMIEGSPMQSIWHQASQAIQEADRVMFVGYSLPEADVAIRALINPLWFRLDRGDVEIKVVDPSDSVRAKYKTYLGDNIIHCNESAIVAFTHILNN